MSDLPSYPESAAEREAAEPAPGEGEDVVLSGWWRRVAALILDTLIIVTAAAALFGLGFLVGLSSESLGVVVFVLAVLAMLVGPIFYNIYFVGREPGATPGKMALGIRIRDAEHDRAIGYGRATGRYLITVALGFFTIPLILDYLWPLWDGRNQALHDKVATSIVVRS